MVRLYFLLDSDDEVAKVVLKQLHNNLSQPFDLVKMPYSRARLVGFGRFLHVLELDICFPPFYLFGFLVFALGLFLWRSPWLLVLGLLISLSGFLWLPLPYMVALRRLLRKKDFKGNLRFLSSSAWVTLLLKQGGGEL